MPRGGARKGSGPAPKVRTFDDATRKELDRVLRRKAREKGGSTWLAQVVDLAYDSGAMHTARLGALKLIADIKGVIVKQSHKTVDETKRIVAPVVLPPMADDPAKIDMEAAPEEQRH